MKIGKTGIFPHEEYRRLKNKYQIQAEQHEQAIKKIQEEWSRVEPDSDVNPYLKAFLDHRNIETLYRGILVDLVKNIYIHKGGEIEIEFHFADQYRHILELAGKNEEKQVRQGGGSW